MRILYPNGEPANVTTAQEEAVARSAARFHLPEPITVHPMLGANGAVLLDVGTMWLGIELDGYTHS